MSSHRESVVFVLALFLWLCVLWALRSISLYFPIAALCVGAFGKQVADRHKTQQDPRSKLIATAGTTVATVSVAAVGAFALYFVYRIVSPSH